MIREEAKAKFHAYTALGLMRNLYLWEADEMLKCYKVMFPNHELWTEHMKERMKEYDNKKSNK